MTSIITRAAFTIGSAWRRYRRKRMEREALRTIIARKNDHLRRDAGLAADDRSPRSTPYAPEGGCLGRD